MQVFKEEASKEVMNFTTVTDIRIGSFWIRVKDPVTVLEYFTVPIGGTVEVCKPKLGTERHIWFNRNLSLPINIFFFTYV